MASYNDYFAIRYKYIDIDDRITSEEYVSFIAKYQPTITSRKNDKGERIRVFKVKRTTEEIQEIQDERLNKGLEPMLIPPANFWPHGCHCHCDCDPNNQLLESCGKEPLTCLVCNDID